MTSVYQAVLTDLAGAALDAHLTAEHRPYSDEWIEKLLACKKLLEDLGLDRHGKRMP